MKALEGETVLWRSAPSMSGNNAGDFEFVELHRKARRLLLDITERLAENLHDFGKR